MAYFPGEGHTTPPIHLLPAGGCSTTPELTTKANQLKAQIQELANSQQSINRLPCEVLAHIFVLCKHTKNRKKGRPDLFCLTKLPSICRQWRKVALDMKSLWSLVTLSNNPPFHFSALCLDRSGMTTPLDIEICLSERLLGIGLNHGLDREAMLDALNFIVAHGGATSRWRSFWLYTPEDRRTEPQIAALDFIGKFPMPSLERLEVKYDGLLYTTTQGQQGLERVLHNRSLFHNPPARLKHVTLEWAPTSYLFASPDRPELVGLTHLEIMLPKPLPRLEHINALLAANPMLRVLSIDTRASPYAAPADSEERAELAHLPKINLPNLRALALLFYPRTYNLWWEHSLLRMLDAPKVESLRLRLQMSPSQPVCTQDFIDYLTKGADLSNPKPLFPYLNGLELLGGFTWSYNDSFYKAILAAYPTITTLVLSQREQSSVLNIQPWLVPHLNRLLTRIELTPELKKAIAGRCDAGLGPKIVEVPSERRTHVERIQSAHWEAFGGLGVEVRVSYSSQRVREVLGFEES